MTGSGLFLNPAAPTSATTTSTSHSALLESFHIQGASISPLAPLTLINPLFGFALSYLSLGPLSLPDDPKSRAIYGLSYPNYEFRSSTY